MVYLPCQLLYRLGVGLKFAYAFVGKVVLLFVIRYLGTQLFQFLVAFVAIEVTVVVQYSYGQNDGYYYE